MCSASISQHPVSAMAVGEVTGEVLEGGGQDASLALLFVTRSHAGALEDAAAVVSEVLGPRTLIGCAAESVLANGWEVEASPAVALWAGHVGPTLEVSAEDWPPATPGLDPGAVLLIADPHTFDAAAFMARVAETHPGVPVVGGNASGARGPGGTRLLDGNGVRTAGAVAVVLGSRSPVEVVVSQGCRPIGSPWAVTGVEGRWLLSLGGKPPITRLAEIARVIPEEQRRRLSDGLQLGVLVDEHKADYGPGDFLMRNVLGGNTETGAVALDTHLELGQTVQFHLRDAEAADVDLRRGLGGREVSGALLFTCQARGTSLFAEPHHDAALVSDVLDRPATAGFFAQGEFGPVGGRNFVHAYSASLALFGDRYGG